MGKQIVYTVMTLPALTTFRCSNCSLRGDLPTFRYVAFTPVSGYAYCPPPGGVPDVSKQVVEQAKPFVSLRIFDPFPKTLSVNHFDGTGTLSFVMSNEPTEVEPLAVQSIQLEFGHDVATHH